MEQMYEYVDELVMDWVWFYADDSIEKWIESNNKEFDGMCKEKNDELIGSLETHANEEARELALDIIAAIERK